MPAVWVEEKSRHPSTAVPHLLFTNLRREVKVEHPASNLINLMLDLSIRLPHKITSVAFSINGAHTLK